MAVWASGVWNTSTWNTSTWLGCAVSTGTNVIRRICMALGIGL